MKRPQLAIDWIKGRVTFTAIGMPKVDGARGLHLGDAFTARTLRPFDNRALGRYYSEPEYAWVDGELVAPGLEWNDPAMCRSTTSITNTIESLVVPDLIVFDYLERPDLPFHKRLGLRDKELKRIGDPKLHAMPWRELRNMDELLEYDDENVRRGYEGTIVRDPMLPVKEGRSSTTVMHLWRIKRFIDFEALVIELVEAQENRNEAKINRLGLMERSTHKANKVGKKMVGMLKCIVLKDVKYEGRTLFKKGMYIEVGPGESDHRTRALWWARPELIVQQVITVKTMPYGVKEKPRMPTFKAIRLKGV